MELRSYQQEARESIQNEWEKGVQRTLLVLPTGCHAEDEKLLLANGESIKVQDIRIGDRLLGSDGGVRNVLHIQSGHSDLFRVTPIKGESFVVTSDHKLTLSHTSTGEIIDVSVEDWLSWSNNQKHLHKLIRSAAISVFPEAEKNDLYLSPYILGVMLGDGGLKYSINVTTPDDEVAQELENEARRWGMWLEKTPAGKATTYIFKGGQTGCKGGKLHQVLSNLGLRGCGSGEKFVPHNYKTLPIDFRLEIIAGLLDTDGHYRAGGYDFVSKSRQLAHDLAFMCRSIGLAAYVKETVKTCQNDFSGTYYRVSISGDCSIIPCRVRKKRSTKRMQRKNVLRTGFTIDRIGHGNFVGITVDGDNRYLMDDFTITHNCGKTIVFSKVIEDRVRLGERVLVLAHRGELLDQAADKLAKSTGLGCATEKAEQTSIGSWFRVVVGSVQTMMRDRRLRQFAANHFDTIIIDEAHHCISDSYQRVLQYFEDAHVLGVTATPDRGDMRNLGSYFESLAYEYTLPKAIKEGYLSPIKAMTIPLKLDLSAVGQQAGDFKSSDLGTALDPYLDSIAAEMWKVAKDRKIVVFLPLVKTSQKFTNILNSIGFKAAEVNGESQDRAEVLADFDAGKYNVLCNSMLLTEGWDCPSVDCVVVLRPTKVRSLYSQMVGRGTRLYPGKTELLLLDFLWHTERHELCHPAHLIAENEETAQAMTKQIEEAGIPLDLEAVEKQAAEDVISQREEALAKQLEEMKRRKRKLVDPLQFEMSIQAEDLSSYVPSFGWEMAPPSDAQVKTLEKLGILPDEIDNAGKATKLLERLDKRRSEGLTTPKQIRFLEQRGFQHVGTWSFETAKRLIDRIAGNGWRVPEGINPREYRGE